MLAVASVIGREFRLATLERVTGMPGDELLDLLEEAVQARLIQEQDAVGHYRFSHALVQETLYGELSTARRVRLHGQIGDAIEQLQAANLTPYFGELAQHYFQAAAAGQAEKAIEYAVKAAELADGQVAWEAAVEHYQHALQASEFLDHPDQRLQCEILLALGDAQTWSTAVLWPSDAVRSFREAAALAETIGAHDLFGRAVLGLGGDEPNSSPGVEQLQLVERALAKLDAGDSPLRAKTAGSACRRYLLERAGRVRSGADAPQ